MIIMKDVIIEEKTREKEGLSDDIADITATAEVAQALSPVDLTGKYMWAMSNANIDAVKELGLTGIKKYQRRAGQVEIEFDWLHNWISVLATFVRHSRRMYKNDEMTKNMNVRQDIDPE